MDVAFIQSVWTVIAMVVFIGIVIWAFSKRKKADFEEAGRMALNDEKPIQNVMSKTAAESGSNKLNKEE
jgi:cytochrome c oxidase cbb3-type subunit 4